MKLSRRELRRLILKEFKDTKGAKLASGGPGDIPPPEDSSGGGGGGGSNPWRKAYRKMQTMLTPLLIEYFQSDGENYDALSSFVSSDNPLWKTICAGPAPSGYPEDSNIELPDQFLNVLIAEPGGALPDALYQTQGDGIPMANKISNFVNGMLLSHSSGISSLDADFLEYVSHSWEDYNESATDQFSRVIKAMFAQDYNWPSYF